MEGSSSSLERYQRGLPAGSSPVVRTDGGGACRSERWKSACRDAGAVRSMSRKGACEDNARAEGFFGTLKEEFFHGRDRVGTTYETIAGRRRRLGIAL